MDRNHYIETISESWSESGFLGKLRNGKFDLELYNVLYSTILKLRYEDYENIERETISILWFIPIFMDRQKEYVENMEDTKFNDLREKLVDAIGVIFGYP